MELPTLPLSRTINDTTFTIVQVEINKRYNCTKCWKYENKEDCSYRQMSNVSPKNVLCSTEIELIVANNSRTVFKPMGAEAQIVDTNGFSYNATAICDDFKNGRNQYGLSREFIYPNTKKRIILTFPELETDLKISKLIINYINSATEVLNIAFVLNPLVNETEQDFMGEIETSLRSPISNSKGVDRDISRLKELIFRRLNNVLTRTEKIRLENDIKNTEYQILLAIESYNFKDKEYIKAQLNNILSDYKLNVDVISTNVNVERQSAEGARDDLGETIFRSAWEANIARLLNHLEKKWSYEKERFNFGDVDYLPDFFIDSDNTIVEVKGFWDNQSAQRVDSFIRTFPNKNFIIIDKDNYPDVNLIFSRYEPILNWENTPCAQGEATLVTVVGLQFIPDKSVLTQLHIGDSLKLVAEPDNQYDSFAIAVYTLNDKLVGHIEKQFAAIYSWKLKEGMLFNVVIETIKPKVLKVKISRSNWDTPIIPRLFHKKS